MVVQNDSVDALGIKGNHGLLKTGTDRVQLKKLPAGERIATVGRDKAESFDCAMPGLLLGSETATPELPASQLVIDRPCPMSDKERLILQAIIATENGTKAEIYRQAGLSKNGPNSEIIDRLRPIYEGAELVQ